MGREEYIPFKVLNYINTACSAVPQLIHTTEPTWFYTGTARYVCLYGTMFKKGYFQFVSAHVHPPVLSFTCSANIFLISTCIFYQRLIMLWFHSVYVFCLFVKHTSRNNSINLALQVTNSSVSQRNFTNNLSITVILTGLFGLQWLLYFVANIWCAQ